MAPRPGPHRSSLDAPVEALRAVFRRSRSPREAHERGREVLVQMARDAACLRDALDAELRRPEALNTRHYPSVLVPIAHNAHFSLVANCFLPHPAGETDLTCNSIHHHGHLLLTTATAFGPGYGHWRFTTPRAVPSRPDLFAIEVLDRRPHGLHDVAFVDAFMPHAVFFPRSLTITFALWSSEHAVTWRERLKRVPAVEARRDWLRRMAKRLGFSRALHINVEAYLDYYPAEEGFVGMRERVQFQRGPNEDYLFTLFHILQQTGNEALAPDEDLLRRVPLEEPALVRRLAGDLRAGRAIAPRFSENLHWLPHMNFKVDAIEKTLAALATTPPRSSARPSAAVA